MKGKSDIAIGNIVGSNIFNILFVVGTAALITPVVFEANFVIDTLIAVAAGVRNWSEETVLLCWYAMGHILFICCSRLRGNKN